MITIQEIEKYSENHPQEVLILRARDNQEEVEIMIFKGFSSNLTGSTAFDPDMPILSPDGEIISCDRILSPYNPNNPQYIEKNISPSELLKLLRENESK
ncbi:hypothetical protein VKI21_08910 [Cyanobacterium aponinum UTEX 3222]|uniref:DUF7734 domain-containing protein n=2 Tax=Cyanobacterium aponinum TaxID=379064 RepID=K9Z504_CYAAP|nr:hypothetical protein [Cyanobacterium aponinum]WRL43794.1 hypothetical protein VKI21_08910 [Cyanobacterium aponinum UTEX 3222]AFZ54251.1 hypothetical protein Cyan10605_2165 [Cyanobacterium aponinum PCC 10605]MBD2393858.1 hypothetical protein [Cyanobacterium aponinum FACHB-4101]PHV64281.1 hypothetical protein CSQ80_00205 [Cyanobacterium aponinum IPPAS B-1201]WPF89085.1 hypothetical protein SAY89_02060 [Cyanobacterium aponinum AL20115]